MYDPNTDGKLEDLSMLTMPLPNPTLAMPKDCTEEDFKDESISKRTISHKETRNSLFPKGYRKISISDIKQACIGNCWYLAAICSIVHNPNGHLYISHLIRDLKRHVLVYMFDVNKIPHLLKMEKSVIFHRYSRLVFHSTGGLWVTFLEKAAAYFNNKDKNFASSEHYSYLNVIGGHSHHAFTMLLGVNAFHEKLNKSTLHWSAGTMEGKGFRDVIMDPTSVLDIEELRDFFSSPEVFEKQKVLDKKRPDRQKWKKPQDSTEEFIFKQINSTRRKEGKTELSKEEIRQMFSEMSSELTQHSVYKAKINHNKLVIGYFLLAKNIFTDKTEFKQWAAFILESGFYDEYQKKALKKTIFSLEDLENMFSKYDPTSRFTKVLDWVKRKNLYPPKRGLGAYTREQDKLFERITGYLKENRLVCMGTYEDLGPSTGTGHSGGESKVRGAVGGHAFAVVQTHTSRDGNKLIRVINPWGRYGRGYKILPEDTPSLGIVEPTDREEYSKYDEFSIESGDYWLFLDDFCSIVQNLYYTDPLDKDKILLNIGKIEVVEKSPLD